MQIQVHVRLRGKIEKFNHETNDVQKVFDYYEGHVGTVMAVYDILTNERLTSIKINI